MGARSLAKGAKVIPGKWDLKFDKGTFKRDTYFLGLKCQNEKIQTWTQGGTISVGKWKHGFYYKHLKCKDCDRIFQSSFGYASHAKRSHGFVPDEIPKSITESPAPPTSAKSWKGSKKSLKKGPGKRKKKCDDSSSDDEELDLGLTTQSDDEFEKSIENFQQPKKPPRKKGSGLYARKKKKVVVPIETYNLETAELFGKLDTFQPRLEIWDAYKFPNVGIIDIPDKNESVQYYKNKVNREPVKLKLIKLEPSSIIGEITSDSDLEVLEPEPVAAKQVIDLDDEDEIRLSEPEAKKDYVKRVRHKSIEQHHQQQQQRSSAQVHHLSDEQVDCKLKLKNSIIKKEKILKSLVALSDDEDDVEIICLD